MTRSSRRPLIPRRMLVASAPFGSTQSASSVAGALARGLRAGGAPDPDLCPLLLPRGEPDPGTDALPEHDQRASEVRLLLDALDFDARMRRARGVVVCVPVLRERALAGSVAFEIATRARQGGVPAYAVTGENRLDRFDARILDLQVILTAGSAQALAGAGRKLARLVDPHI